MPVHLLPPVRDESVAAGDITLHVIQWGEQGPPVVFVHGITANAFCFQSFADELATDHRVIAYDLRGRGDSAKPPTGYSVPIHAADLLALIEALKLERPAIVGHSLGALIALYFAAHYPQKLSKLVLIDAGAPLPWKTPEEQPAWLTASFSRLGLPVPSYEEYRERLKAAPFLGPYWNEYIDTYFEHDVQQLADGSVVARASRDGVLEDSRRIDEARPEEQWSHVQAPTLLLRAGQGLFLDNDQMLPEAGAEAMRQHIANCRYINYPSLNHYTIILGTDQRPALEIRKFLVEKE
ncbi:MAG: alpha/beta hydrolase [Ktedonobacteraceae bacterium]|nr:alpha/beta hydrolase [Ktedonobacteraceae bacterium]